MPLKFFFVPARDSAVAELELEDFTQRHRILTVERQWLQDGAGSGWSIVVEYTGTPSTTSSGSKKGKANSSASKTEARIDYSEVLTVPQFALFNKLRDRRNQVAADAGIAPYVICTNAQIATMVELHPRSLAELRKVPQFGVERVTKFGAVFLEILLAEGNTTDAAGDEPVSSDSGSREPATGDQQGVAGKTPSP